MIKNKVIIYIIITVFLSVFSFFLGYYSKDSGTGDTPGLTPVLMPDPEDTFQVSKKTVTGTYEAVGTVRPRTETKIDAQITGKVLSVKVKPGDFVKKGSTMLLLDSKEYKTRMESAEEGLRSAEARREQAKKMIEAAQAKFDESKSQYMRFKSLYEDNSLSESELEQAEARYLQADAELKHRKDGLQSAEAGVNQAGKLIEEARILLSYTEIKATEDAEIARRMVEPGDLAVPGKPLLIVQTAGKMRLEAFIREGLINRIKPGSELEVRINALDTAVTGFVEEVVPAADPKTRSFQVKVGLPYVNGLYPGMFGRLMVPSGTKQTILIPENAVTKIGQLDTVMVKESDSWKKCYVKTGKKIDGMIEILSGLEGNEIIGIPGNKNA